MRRTTASKVLYWLLAIPFLFCATDTGASWIESLGQGSRATAMGNAYIGVADDLSAVWYNPAGLTQLIGSKKVDQTIGLSLNTLVMQVEEVETVKPKPFWAEPTTTGLTYRSDLPSNVPFPFAALGFELSDWCYLAPLSTLVSFAGATQFSETTGNMRYSGYYVSVVFMDWSPSIALKVRDWLSVGFSFNVNMFNQIKLQNRLGDGYLPGATGDLVGGLPPGIPEFLGSLLQDGRDDGKLLVRTDEEWPTGVKPVNDVDINFRDYGFRLGILLRPLHWLRVGVSYRSEMRVHAEGSISLVLNPDDVLVQLLNRSGGGGNPPLLSDDSKRFQLVFKLPAQVGLGIAVQPVDWFLWSADYTWTDWHSARKVDSLYVKDGGLGPTQITQLNVFRNWSSVHSVRTGVELRLAPRFFLRAGFWYDPSPVSDAYWDVGSGLNDYFIYSAGAGYVGLFDGLLDVNAHVQVLESNKRRIDFAEGKNLGGTKFYGNPLQGAVANRDFADVIDGSVVSWGLDFILHF